MMKAKYTSPHNSTNSSPNSSLKQAEEALQAEHNKLLSLMEAMEYTVTIQDIEYNIIYQNEQSKIASGGDHVGEKCYRAYEGKEKVCDGCPVEKAFKDGKPYTAERKTVILGKVAFWENTASPIRDARGKIVSCLELARDITERKKQEQALADELTQRRLLIDRSLDGIVVLDENDKVYEANQRFADMLGYTLEEVHELHTWDWDKEIPPEKIHEMGRNVDEKGLHLETKHTRKDGSVIDVDISISGVMYRRRKLIFCIQRDITERKQAEEALQAERNKLQSLINAMEYTVTIQDTEYNIIYQNEQSRIASGGDHAGEKCYRAYEGREKVCDECPVEEAFKDGKSHTAERKTVILGKVAFWENTASPIRDARGKITSCLEVARDVTKRKRIERQSHEREIAEARAQELSISHQRLTNAQESLRKDIASQLHGTVQSRLILLEHKIVELEAMARSKRMTKELAAVRQRLEELRNEHIRSISHRLFPSILRMGITAGLESLIDEYSAKLLVDLRVSKKLRDREQADRKLLPDNVKLALYRIAEEALTNTSKHAPETNNIVVKLSLPDSRILRLTVRDNSPGSNTTSPSTGIGLSLISDYAAAAGGSCTIKKIPGKGTQVTAELPLS